MSETLNPETCVMLPPCRLGQLGTKIFGRRHPLDSLLSFSLFIPSPSVHGADTLVAFFWLSVYLSSNSSGFEADRLG